MSAVDESQIKWIFVYGTLKPGFTEFAWNGLIHNDNYKLTCEQATLHNYTLCMHREGFPTVFAAEGKHVKGYIITSDKWQELLNECDIIEETPAFYLRVPITVVRDNDGASVVAFGYEVNPNRYKVEELTPIGAEFLHTTPKDYPPMQQKAL